VHEVVRQTRRRRDLLQLPERVVLEKPLMLEVGLVVIEE
jgi:hypothetical protein